jgi:hypothetical protein
VNDEKKEKYNQTDLHYAYPVIPEPKAHSLFKTTTHDERGNVDRLPTGRRKKIEIFCK